MRYISFLVYLLLLSCSNTSSYDYFIMHPNELQKAYSACQINETSRCVVVKQAAHDVSEVIYEQTRDPEQFGKKIMILQAELEMMKKNNAADRKTYEEQLKKLQLMYAVLGAQGPE